MKAWKQVLWSAVIVVAAFLGWAYFYPGAGPVLARYGIDWFSGPATGEANLQQPAQGQGGQRPAGQGGQQAGQGQGGARQGTPGAGGQPPRGGAGGFSRDAVVVVQPVTIGTVNDRLTAIGTGQAVRTVSVKPFVSGQIVEIPVFSGARVNAGDVIIRLDSVEEELAVERSRIALDDAERKVARTESLLAQKAVSSVDADTAKSDLSAARVALRGAQLDLSRRTVTAPISGSIGILSVNTGDYVTPQSDITTIDDRSEILVEFYVPERFAARMSLGKTISATAIARPGDVFEGEITAIDNRVDEASRTLRVQARIANDDDVLRAGMSFEVTVRFDGESWPSIDPLAIQWDSKGSYIWRIVDGKAGRVDVTIIQRNSDSVLVKADLKEGDVIVTEGVQSVRAGGGVRVAGAGPQDGAGTGAGAGNGQRPQAGNGQAGNGQQGNGQGGNRQGGNGAPRNGAGS